MKPQWALLAAIALLVPGRAAAAPPPPPGGHLAVYYGGDNTHGFPVVTDAGDADALEGLGSVLRVQVAPNPFVGRTTLRFAAGRGDAIRVRIFTTHGRLVRELTARAERLGTQELPWDGRDGDGAPQPAGVYFYEVQAGARSASGRLVFIR